MTARTARGWLLLPRLGVGQPVGIRPRRAGVRREMSALLRSLLAVAVISTVVGVAQPFGIGYRPNQAGNSLSPGKAPLRQALLSSFNEPAGGSPGDYAFVASDDGDITLLDAATGVVVATAQMNLCPPGQNGNDNCLPWYSCYQGVNDTYIQNLNLSPNGRDLYIYVGSLEGIFDCDNSPGGEFVLNTASGVFQRWTTYRSYQIQTTAPIANMPQCSRPQERLHTWCPLPAPTAPRAMNSTLFRPRLQVPPPGLSLCLRLVETGR